MLAPLLFSSEKPVASGKEEGLPAVTVHARGRRWVRLRAASLAKVDGGARKEDTALMFRRASGNINAGSILRSPKSSGFKHSTRECRNDSKSVPVHAKEGESRGRQKWKKQKVPSVPKITLPLAFWLCAVSRGGGLEDC